MLYQNKASKWLSLLLFLWSMYLIPYMLGYAGWYEGGIKRQIMFFVPFMQVLLIGPVVYFYTKSLLNPGFNISRKDWIHFIPFVLYSIYSLIVFITDILVLDEYYFYADNKDKDLSDWYQAVGLVSMVFYLVLSLRDYANYKRLIFEKVSYADNILFSWIKNFMIAFLGLLILRVLFFIINPEWGNFGNQFWYYLAFSFVFYYISFNGYAHAVKTSTLIDSENVQATIFEEKENTNEKSQHLETEILKWKPKLEALISEDQLYKNSRLNLSDVAKELKTTPKMISAVVNSGFNMNFNDFINHYRVEAVIDQLKNGEQNTKTLLGIALDCGFNSKATATGINGFGTVKLCGLKREPRPAIGTIIFILS
ncbi:MAG: AraC family transcriptional regulator [Psychroserpens sp.]|nr:AraC family transcriptional regulator [Psychroserpens sp.]